MIENKNAVHQKSLLNFHNNSLGVIIHLLIAIIIFIFWQFAAFIFQILHCVISGKKLSYVMENMYYGLEIGSILGSYVTILLIIFIIKYLYKENGLSYLNINPKKILKNIKKLYPVFNKPIILIIFFASLDVVFLEFVKYLKISTWEISEIISLILKIIASYWAIISVIQLTKLSASFRYLMLFFIWTLSITFIADKFDIGTLKEGEEFAKSLINEGNPILLILAIGIVGPIFEEIFFRGFLFKHLEIKWGGVMAVLFTSIIFTIVHLQYNLVILGLVLFPMAILLGYARLKTKSLMPPIIIHCINNIITVLVTMYQ
tara:strand:+ start:756 stop:1706 length:951 start_codon:yes stop_codon:yes gene_type:complete